MAKGKRNNKRGRGGYGHNTTNDSDANSSTIAHDGSGGGLPNHNGFSTGAFGTSDIDGSGLQSEVIIERNEHVEGHDYREEVHIPARSRTSSMGAEANDGFLNPNDFMVSGGGQNSQSSVRSRTSVSNFERAHRMSQLSIQTNQDEFVLVPGSGGHDGHASIRSMRSQNSRQSANVAMSSRDDILTEGDETGGDEMRREDETMRKRLGSTASQMSRGSAFDTRHEDFGAGVEVPVRVDVAPAGMRSRRASQMMNGDEWDEQREREQAHRSHASLYSHKSNGWNGEDRREEAYVHVPSRHASRASIHSHHENGWQQEQQLHAAGGGGAENVAPPPGNLSRHPSRMSVNSYISNIDEIADGLGEEGGFDEREVQIEYQGGSRPASHYASRNSLASHRSHAHDGAGGFVHVPPGFGDAAEEVAVPAASHHASRTSLYSSVSRGGGVGNHLPASRDASRYASKASVHSGYEHPSGGAAPSHHASKASIYSHAGGDAGVVPFSSHPPSIRASRASIHSHADAAPMGSRAPSHHASRTSIRSHLHGDGWTGEQEIVMEEREENGGRQRRTSRTSTRSQMSCVACADDGDETTRENGEGEYGLPQLGDEIVVPGNAVEEWGDHREHGRQEEEEEERLLRETEGYEREMEMQRRQQLQMRSAYGSKASVASHGSALAGGQVQQQQQGRGSGAPSLSGSLAPIPAVRLSRASLNQQQPTDWNHNSMGSLHGAGGDHLAPPLSHHASKLSLRSVQSETQDPSMHTAFSKTSVASHRSAPRERRFSSRSTQDVAEWGERVNDEEQEMGEEEVFDYGGQGSGHFHGGMSRGESHRSIYSTRSSKAGEQTEENLLQAMLNRSREPSLGSLGERPFIPPKDGWSSSHQSIKSAHEHEQERRSRRHSRSSSVHLVGAGIDLRDEVVIPLNLPLPKPRSRSVSIASSRRSLEGGVLFADQPELYAHPDERFGEKSIEGIPFRPTFEHDKTPQPNSKRGSKVYKHSESEEELRALASSASASHTSVIADNTRPASAGFNTPKSRNSRESYLGTAERSMPSPSPFNQTQFQRDEYEAHKEKVSRSFLPFSPLLDRSSLAPTEEMSTQTGETIARAAGQKFALHYGGDDHLFSTLSAKPGGQGVTGQSGVPPPPRPASAASSALSMAPPPPSCSPPHEEETACHLQHHRPLGREELLRMQQERQWQHEQQMLQQHQQGRMYDHGDAGVDAPDAGGRSVGVRKSSSGSRFAPLPAYDMSFVEQYESRSMASASKLTTSSSASTHTTTATSSSTLRSQHDSLHAASAVSSYVQHLRPVQPSQADTNVSVRPGVAAAPAAARTAISLEMTAPTGGNYGRPGMEGAGFSSSKSSIAQKAALFEQRENGAGKLQQPGQTRSVQQPGYYQVPVQQLQHPTQQQHYSQPMHPNLQQQQQQGAYSPVFTQQHFHHPQHPLHSEPPVVRPLTERPAVEIKRALSSQPGRPHLQQSGYVHIERPKMNNSFERSNHPAAAILNSMLSTRASNHSANSSRSEEPGHGLSRHASSVGGTSGGYLPHLPMYTPAVTTPSSSKGAPRSAFSSPGAAYQRSIRPLASDDATFHYEMKHDLNCQQQQRMNEEISKDEISVLSRVGAVRADLSPKGATQMTQGRMPMRSKEAERAYSTYHDKKASGDGGSTISLTAAPKPFTPASPYRSAGLGQQQQVYGAFRAHVVPAAPVKKQPAALDRVRAGGMGGVGTAEKEPAAAATAATDANKYTGSTIRRAIPQRGHIRNLAAAFDTIQTKADRELTVIEPNNTSVLQRRASGSTTTAADSAPFGGGGGVAGARGSTSSMTSSARGFAPRGEGMQLQQPMQYGQGDENVGYRVPVQLVQQPRTASTSSSRREKEMQLHEYEMRSRTEYNERSIHEWQAANEQRHEMGSWPREQPRHEEEEEELCLDSESDRAPSMNSNRGGATRLLPVHVLRTSTPLAGVKADPRALARALEKIPSIRGDETIERRGRAAARGVKAGGVRALASRFEQAAEEEAKEKARSVSMTPRMRRKQEPRRVEGEDAEDRREAAARRLSRGAGGVDRMEREKEMRRSQSAHAGVRKRRSSSTSSESGEESVMREMEAVERMAREEILRKEREEMRMRKERRGGVKETYHADEAAKIDEMFRALDSQESAGERGGTVASSRGGGTTSGAESVRTQPRDMQQLQHVQHHEYQMQQSQQLHYQYQQQQQYREHNEHQHHHYQAHLQPMNTQQQSNAAHFHSIPSPAVAGGGGGGQQAQSMPQQSRAAAAAHRHHHQPHLQQQQPRAGSPGGSSLGAHLHAIGPDGGLEGGVVSRRESTQTMKTTNTQSSTATGLVYSPSVYRETGRAMRGDGGSMMQLGGEHGGIERRGRASTMGGGAMNTTTASSPHFSPVNIRGPETAGQRVATYESRDGRNPVRVPSRQVRPYALATSTPMGTVASSARGGAVPLMTEDGVVVPAEGVEDDSFLSTISGESRGSGAVMGARSPLNQAEYKKQMARLQTVQSMEEEKISITSKALAHARKKQNPSNELAAQRTILLARLRVAALKRELQRLSALAIVRNPPPPVSKNVLGAMDISDITLHLNRNLCARPGEGGSCSFGFLVVLKCGVEVEATAPVCMLVGQRPAALKTVHFPEHLRFSNLPVDFTIRLEVYVMSMQKLREPKEESCTAVLATKARNLLPGARRAAITAGPGGSSGSGIGSPVASNGELPVGELVRCGHTALDRDSVGSIRLYLDAPEYPLEGTIELSSRCSRLPSSVEVDLRGFLTMYKVVGGYGSWVRYWAVLRRGVINFWKYPDDEQLDRGGPVASADLSKCTDSEIVPAAREICTRQFAFSIDMLVATTPSIVEKKRVLLAADTREQLKAWLAALNETLAAIRA